MNRGIEWNEDNGFSSQVGREKIWWSTLIVHLQVHDVRRLSNTSIFILKRMQWHMQTLDIFKYPSVIKHGKEEFAICSKWCLDGKLIYKILWMDHFPLPDIPGKVKSAQTLGPSFHHGPRARFELVPASGSFGWDTWPQLNNLGITGAFRFCTFLHQDLGQPLELQKVFMPWYSSKWSSCFFRNIVSYTWLLVLSVSWKSSSCMTIVT